MRVITVFTSCGVLHGRAVVPVAAVVAHMAGLRRIHLGVEVSFVLPVFFLGHFLGRELRLFGRLRRHEHFQGIVVGLKPRAHLFLQRARQKPDVFAEGDDRPGD